MKTIITIILILLIIAIVAVKLWHSNRSNTEPAIFWQPSNETNQASIDHSQWQEILDEYLISDSEDGINRVDYDSLQTEPELLQSYLGNMTSLDPRQYNQTEQFAYWVNLYNALTFKVIIDHYPISSIRKISNSGLPIGPWDDEVAVIAGQPITLNTIEHRILRSFWKDHRIHFAVNCASIGCPNVQPQAFNAANTESLLEAAAIEYLRHPRGLQIHENHIVLSSLFEWYQDDFGNSQEEALNTLAQYLNSGKHDQFLSNTKKIKYEYDWSLNDFIN